MAIHESLASIEGLIELFEAIADEEESVSNFQNPGNDVIKYVKMYFTAAKKRIPTVEPDYKTLQIDREDDGDGNYTYNVSIKVTGWPFSKTVRLSISDTKYADPPYKEISDAYRYLELNIDKKTGKITVDTSGSFDTAAKKAKVANIATKLGKQVNTDADQKRMLAELKNLGFTRKSSESEKDANYLKMSYNFVKELKAALKAGGWDKRGMEAYQTKAGTLYIKMPYSY